jgi:hypothetical protein
MSECGNFINFIDLLGYITQIAAETKSTKMPSQWYQRLMVLVRGLNFYYSRWYTLRSAASALVREHA